MRTMNHQDFRVLNAVESGMKDRELVPLPLINAIANLRHSGTDKIISSLLCDKLLSHNQSCGYNGYCLTNLGYDVLALHDLKTRGIIGGIGDRIGTGKDHHHPPERAGDAQIPPTWLHLLPRSEEETRLFHGERPTEGLKNYVVTSFLLHKHK